MSFPAGNQVLGNDDELAAFLRQAVADEVAKNQGGGTGNQPPVVSPAGPTPIPVTLNGQTFQFNSPEELSTSLQGLVAEYNNRLAQAQQAVPSPKNEVRGDDDPSFDVNKFVEKMTSNPLEAFDYADEHRYGVKNPSKAIKDALGAKDELEKIKQTLSVYQFRDAHPEVSGNPQAAQVISQIIQSQGLSQDARGLEAAYALGVVRGLLPHPSQFQQQQAPQQNQAPQFQGSFQQNPYGAGPFQPPPFTGVDPRQFNGGSALPPPRVGRGANDPVQDISAMAEDMSADQILALFNRLQPQR